jgi:DNA-binding SARP family transcriptional activator/tetratricopeptide (TPR) repeat protein
VTGTAKTWFGFLGTLHVRSGQDWCTIPAGSQRVVLAALAVRAGHVVSFDELACAIWDDTLPAGARAAVRNYVRRLRVTLGPAAARIVTRNPGYVLEAAADEVDLVLFGQLCRDGGTALRAAEWQRAFDVLHAALGLWRGTPLADVPSRALRDEYVPVLESQRLQAAEWRLEAGMELGMHSQLLGEAEALTREHPLHERLHARHMLALYRCGRQAEALAVYQRVRRALVEELGVEPGPELNELHNRILVADAKLATPLGTGTPAKLQTARVEPATAGSGRAQPDTPHQLPTGVRHFAGRKEQLGILDGLLKEVGGPGKAVVISAIGGTAGIGKTALAVHWAHRVAGEFPDGQLYANLRGFDPSGMPVAAETLIRDFLGAFGIPSARIPASYEARIALYRTVLATKRMLIVLDNARDADQVQPLLPGSPGCFVLVTSRAGLVGLAATEGAQLLTLDLPSMGEAHELLTRRLGVKLLTAEPTAADELIRLCARLPLALGIVAARAASCPGLSLTALAAELAGEAGPLDALDTGTSSSSVRAAFSWSYRGLADAAARLFRLLGIHPGPDISAATAASLAGLTPQQVRPLLRELVQAGLIAEHMPGRFALHDLLRAYAAEQAAGSLDAESSTALNRVLDHYLRTGHDAALILYRHRAMIPLPPSRPGVVPETFEKYDQALAWFEVERQGLEAAIAAAAAAGLDLYAWQISWTLVDFLHWRGHWNSLIATQNIALAAAHRLNEWAGAAVAHRSLARAYAELGELRHASTHLGLALELYRRLDDPGGQAHVHLGLGMVLDREGRYFEAIGHAQQSLSLHRASGEKAGQADALNAIGWCHAELREYEKAFHHSSQALALHQALGNRIGEAHTWDTLGYIHYHSGEHTAAASCYRSAISLFRDLGNSHYTAIVLTHLGEAYREIGDIGPARDAWQQALSLLRDLDHVEAADVQAKLDHLVGAGRDGLRAAGSDA